MEVVKARKFAPLMMVASLSLLSACGSSNGTDAASDLGRKIKAIGGGSGGSTTPTPTPTPTPTSITAVTYDTSIGNGVDANGFADLPLRSGAKRFFVNSSAGSDSNSCAAAQSASTPKATLASATSCLTSGEGDQILIAQGTSYAAGLNNISGAGGYSPLYPTVIQSYDPADPTNEAKYGRAAANSRPVLNTGGTASQYLLMGSGTSGKYFAVRGLDFNPGSGVQLAGIVMLPNTNGTPDYILFENDIFRYTQLTLDNHGSAGGVRATKLIVRNSSFYNEYGDHSQGMYVDNVDGTTIEDSVFYANGRIGGVSRDAPQSSGGASIFNHPIYMQDNTRNTVVRRNVFIDTATDGGNLKGGGTYTQNLVIRCANAFAFGSGNNYSIDAPNGVVIEGAYNAVIGSNIVNSTSGAIGWGVHTVNGMQGSSAVHHNVLAMNNQSTGYAWMAEASPDTYNVALPNYTDFHDNVSYKWNSSGQSTQIIGSLTHATFENNLWDDPSSGTNVNNGGHAFPNAYTEASLLSALGYADETSFINDVINNPEKHVQRQGVALMLSGYGVDTSAMKW